MAVDGQLHAPDILAPEMECRYHGVGPGCGVDTVQEKVSFLCRESNTDSWILQSVAYPLYRLRHESPVADVTSVFLRNRSTLTAAGRSPDRATLGPLSQ
jgi:hypothetical protein